MSIQQLGGTSVQTFTIRGIDAEGNVVEVGVRAWTEQEAKARAEASGLKLLLVSWTVVRAEDLQRERHPDSMAG